MCGTIDIDDPSRMKWVRRLYSVCFLGESADGLDSVEVSTAAVS